MSESNRFLLRSVGYICLISYLAIYFFLGIRLWFLPIIGAFLILGSRKAAVWESLKHVEKRVVVSGLAGFCLIYLLYVAASYLFYHQ